MPGPDGPATDPPPPVPVPAAPAVGSERRDGRPPIFIVGLPRSGTTLLATMLDAHHAIDCGPETFFFARLPHDPARLLAPGAWPEPAVDYICSLRLRDSPIHQLYGRTPSQVREALAARPPSLAAMLESLTAARADAAGKQRWAEKTPRHMARVPLIRQTFPDAAIVRVVRDPRAAALSMTRVPFASDSLLVNLYSIERADAAAEPHLRQDRWLLTVRFEDLVRDPTEELRRVCDFVGEPFDERMLSERDATALTAGHEWWKQKASEAPDTSRVEAWKTEMSADDQRAAAVICHDMLVRHGYPGAVEPRATVIVEPDGFVARHEDAARRLALAGVVVARRGAGGRGPGRSRAADKVGARRQDIGLAFWPAGGRDPWHLGRSARGRVRGVARMGVQLARRRLSRRPAVLILDDENGEARGAATRLAGLLLRMLARRTTQEAWLSSVAGELR